MKKLIPLFALLILFSCKKDITKISPPPRPETPISSRTDEQKLRDSVYYYYKEQSYWTESVGTYDPISSFTDKYNTPDNVLSALMQQTPFHAGYNGPIDRFSRIDDISSDGGSRAKRADLADGYGIYLTFARVNNAVYLYAYFIEGGSPAESKGMRRGDRIIEMNGNTDMSQNNISYIQKALDGPNLNLKVLREGKEVVVPEMTYTSYDINPVTKDSVLTVGTKKYGYLALSSFEEMTDDRGNSTAMLNDLNAAFDNFQKNNVNELILDFRVNTGGYVSTAIYLANKIINSNGDGKLMFSYDVNKNLEKYKSGRNAQFDNEIFHKNNTTEIQKVVFLVTEYTASAAEIVISVLKPYMDVKLVAEKSATFGKPVGFYRQDIMDKIGLWVASFKVVNASGYTDYWDGIPADIKNVTDNVTLDFGNPNENMVAAALSYLSTGSLTTTAREARASTRFGSSSTTPLNRINKLRERDLIKN
ncbi:S41 family peptidase [Sphingobacterium sp.]|uniref:S41 family peptidase n=1 Tax=Sphingobacterium sp. TaxID=341027 RepID=UPI002896B568|nr:S41 family peptidase [Sphingobacterium sp.]